MAVLSGTLGGKMRERAVETESVRVLSMRRSGNARGVGRGTRRRCYVGVAMLGECL